MPDNNLKLHVKNFGPIAEAEINLRPLTVFVGPSNTGKSYLALLIYALHRFFNGDATGPKLGVRESTFRRSNIVNATLEDTDTMVNWMLNSLPQLSHDQTRLSVPPSVAHMIRPALTLQQFTQALPNDILRCFGIASLERIIRYGHTPETFIMVSNYASNDSGGSDFFKYGLIVNEATLKDAELKLVNAEFFSDIPSEATLRIIRNAIAHHFDEDISHISSLFATPRLRPWILSQEFGSILTDLVGSSIVDPLTRSAYYLPAGRTSLMHQFRLMISSVVSSASHVTFEMQQVQPGLSAVVSDFLQQLINLDDDWNEPSDFCYDVSGRLENNILGGAIWTEVPEIGIPRFTYQPKGWKERMPLLNASSMVSELAPVVLYLRRVVRPGEVLIIEEPESHLHPGMQVEFTRQLAAAVRAGVRILLTTHSEWVLEELANLVRMSDLSESQRQAVNGTDVALTRDEVGVWMFSHDDKLGGSEVKEIKLDIDSGGFPTEYDDVAMGTYNKWARIGNLIEEARNGS